jgi:hypothetical protein
MTKMRKKNFFSDFYYLLELTHTDAFILKNFRRRHEKDSTQQWGEKSSLSALLLSRSRRGKHERKAFHPPLFWKVDLSDV